MRLIELPTGSSTVLIRVKDIVRVEFTHYSWGDHSVFIKNKEAPIGVPATFDLRKVLGPLGIQVPEMPKEEKKEDGA